MRAVPLAAAGLLALAGPATAKQFTVSTAGNHPAVAVDATGTAHVVWDTLDTPGADDATSTTMYCKVSRKANTCAKSTTRTFAPVAGDQDFAGPRVFLAGRAVTVVMTRCCTSEQGADGELHTTHVLAATSTNAGGAFDAPVWIGTLPPDLGGVLSKGAFLGLGTDDAGTALQSSPLTGFTAAPNIFTPKVAVTGGIGASPKGRYVAIADATNTVFGGSLGGDPNTQALKLANLGKGEDVRVGSGPKGADLLYRTLGRQARYIVRRFAGGKLGKPSAVSEAGFPVFGNLTQDAKGKVHAVWEGDLGLTYRVSKPSGRDFGRMKVLSPKTAFYNLTIAANAKSKATVVYDTNVEAGRVGGFTAG